MISKRKKNKSCSVYICLIKKSKTFKTVSFCLFVYIFFIFQFFISRAVLYIYMEMMRWKSVKLKRDLKNRWCLQFFFCFLSFSEEVKGIFNYFFCLFVFVLYIRIVQRTNLQKYFHLINFLPYKVFQQKYKYF